mgnify:CR=1 FL=1
MIIKAWKNPVNCVELSAYLGYPVRKWIQNGDGSFELDIDLPMPAHAAIQALKKKLLMLPLHIEIEGEGTTFDVL